MWRQLVLYLTTCVCSILLNMRNGRTVAFASYHNSLYKLDANSEKYSCMIENIPKVQNTKAVIWWKLIVSSREWSERVSIIGNSVIIAYTVPAKSLDFTTHLEQSISRFCQIHFRWQTEIHWIHFVSRSQHHWTTMTKCWSSQAQPEDLRTLSNPWQSLSSDTVMVFPDQYHVLVSAVDALCTNEDTFSIEFVKDVVFNERYVKPCVLKKHLRARSAELYSLKTWVNKKSASVYAVLVTQTVIKYQVYIKYQIYSHLALEWWLSQSCYENEHHAPMSLAKCCILEEREKHNDTQQIRLPRASERFRKCVSPRVSALVYRLSILSAHHTWRLTSYIVYQDPSMHAETRRT